MSKEDGDIPSGPGMTAFDEIDEHPDGSGQEQTPLTDILSESAGLKADAVEEAGETEEDQVDSEEEETDKEETEEESEEEEGDEPEDEAPKPDDIDPPTVIKTKYDDQEMELYGDMVIPTNVAGKQQSPTLQELRDNFSGKVNYDRKFQDLAGEKKSYQTERITFDQQKTEMNQLVNQLVETARGEDPFQFFDVIAEMLGQDAIKLKREVVENQIRQVEPVAHMSEDEKAQYLEKLELKWERESIDRHKRARSTQEETARNDVKILEVREKYGLSEEGYREAFSLAEKNLTDEKPTIEHVVWFHTHQLATNAVHKVREEWVGGLDANSEVDVSSYNKFVGTIRDMAKNNPEFTQEDLEGIITDAFTNEESSPAARRLSKKVSRTTGGAGRTSQKPKVTKELTSFDQL